jgi:hypothetical protein
VKDRTQEQTPTTMPERAPQVGEIRARWAWVEAEVWTERMLATLDFNTMGLFSLKQAYLEARRSS